MRMGKIIHINFFELFNGGLIIKSAICENTTYICALIKARVNGPKALH